jgi:hypothetical protein
MDDNNLNSSNGVGFLGLMFLIFMTLKIMGYITWSWWWVSAPLWVPFIIVLMIILIFLLTETLIEFLKKIL